MLYVTLGRLESEKGMTKMTIGAIGLGLDNCSVDDSIEALR